MERNTFMPRGLPLVYDRLLIRQYKTYRMLSERLNRSADQLIEQVKGYLDEALAAIEREIMARNLVPDYVLQPV